MDKIPICRMYVDDEMKKVVQEVLESGQYVRGEKARLFEEEFANFCNAKYGISVNSGTAAIFLALKALDIAKGDEVIIPSFTFIATANPIIFLGAIPVFADIDPETFTMKPEEVERLITPKTKAIMPVHLYGHPAEMKPIMEIAKENDLKVIEDACQAHGATCFGHKVGTIGDIACFSFYPSKNMTVAGEGGMITTNDPELAKKMAMMTDHGRSEGYTFVSLGFNFRLSEIHAAIGRVQLKHLPDWIEKRRENAALYGKLLGDMNEITVPREMSWANHAYYLYVIKSERRDELSNHLNNKGIGTAIHYSLPVHKQPYILDTLPPVTLKNTEECADQVLSLPMDPQIKAEEIEQVVEEIGNFFKG
jgi:dTDP-4-amino-4,6-dideoxygalactose transaminase